MNHLEQTCSHGMKVRLQTILLSLLFSQCIHVGAQMAIDINYLKEMPEADRVLADMCGTNSADTAARQWGALSQLREMVSVMADGRVCTGQLMADEKKLVKAYSAAMERAMERVEQLKLGWHFENDESFRAELLKRYFSSSWQAQDRKSVV